MKGLGLPHPRPLPCEGRGEEARVPSHSEMQTSHLHSDDDRFNPSPLLLEGRGTAVVLFSRCPVLYTLVQALARLVIPSSFRFSAVPLPANSQTVGSNN